MLIVNYLDKAISLVESQLEFAKWKIKQGVSLLAKRLKWLGTYIELVELVYALYVSEILGNIPMKELFSVLGEVFDFDFDTKNFSRTFTDIKTRAISDRTKFLNKLQKNLIRKTEEANGNDRKRR
ncbi:MAG: hypothetical protein EZS26_003711 [Candidatus Ordinivivax streblomastigis]|uniref:Uncharacterized protein n=1 Tax=Candidatus Ordinivivax streblomastigis TaxID=2540710 RepID=A0A5M8NT63_9BACT|nr:MAG: hypothetical protein EZS26_003711 [Candidatus Ordinivivax streblomastigis]